MKNYPKLAYIAFLGMAMNLFNRIGGKNTSQQSNRNGVKAPKYIKTHKRNDKIYRAMKNSGKRYASTKGFSIQKLEVA